jgi:DNA adenine methylase Dam
MGNKKKLINKGLIDLFPKGINRFVDLFAGSAVVSMNVEAKKYLVNDIDFHLYELYAMFKVFTDDVIIRHIESRIDEYGLARERTKRNEFKDKEKIEVYKAAYMKLRNEFNKNEGANVLDFYTLMFYSFSQQFRFNGKGEFNMPCGNDCFSEKNKEYIVNGSKFFKQDNVKINNGDFKKLGVEKLNKDDFVYLDPPYFNTTATYNENNGWTEDDENALYSICERLNKHGVKFGMSNVFENKGAKNQKLIDWCEKNNWNVYTFDKFTYMACGKGNSNAKEVFITNY